MKEELENKFSKLEQDIKTVDDLQMDYQEMINQKDESDTKNEMQEWLDAYDKKKDKIMFDCSKVMSKCSKSKGLDKETEEDDTQTVQQQLIRKQVQNLRLQDEKEREEERQELENTPVMKDQDATEIQKKHYMEIVLRMNIVYSRILKVYNIYFQKKLVVDKFLNSLHALKEFVGDTSSDDWKNLKKKVVDEEQNVYRNFKHIILNTLKRERYLKDIIMEDNIFIPLLKETTDPSDPTLDVVENETYMLFYEYLREYELVFDMQYQKRVRLKFLEIAHDLRAQKNFLAYKVLIKVIDEMEWSHMHPNTKEEVTNALVKNIVSENFCTTRQNDNLRTEYVFDNARFNFSVRNYSDAGDIDQKLNIESDDSQPIIKEYVFNEDRSTVQNNTSQMSYAIGLLEDVLDNNENGVNYTQEKYSEWKTQFKKIENFNLEQEKDLNQRRFILLCRLKTILLQIVKKPKEKSVNETKSAIADFLETVTDDTRKEKLKDQLAILERILPSKGLTGGVKKLTMEPMEQQQRGRTETKTKKKTTNVDRKRKRKLLIGDDDEGTWDDDNLENRLLPDKKYALFGTQFWKLQRCINYKKLLLEEDPTLSLYKTQNISSFNNILTSFRLYKEAMEKGEYKDYFFLPEKEEAVPEKEEEKDVKRGGSSQFSDADSFATGETKPPANVANLVDGVVPAADSVDDVFPAADSVDGDTHKFNSLYSNELDGKNLSEQFSDSEKSNFFEDMFKKSAVIEGDEIENPTTGIFPNEEKTFEDVNEEEETKKDIIVENVEEKKRNPSGGRFRELLRLITAFEDSINAFEIEMDSLDESTKAQTLSIIIKKGKDVLGKQDLQEYSESCKRLRREINQAAKNVKYLENIDSNVLSKQEFQKHMNTSKRYSLSSEMEANIEELKVLMDRSNDIIQHPELFKDTELKEVKMFYADDSKTKRSPVKRKVSLSEFQNRMQNHLDKIKSVMTSILHKGNVSLNKMRGRKANLETLRVRYDNSKEACLKAEYEDKKCVPIKKKEKGEGNDEDINYESLSTHMKTQNEIIESEFQKLEEKIKEKEENNKILTEIKKSLQDFEDSITVVLESVPLPEEGFGERSITSDSLENVKVVGNSTSDLIDLFKCEDEEKCGKMQTVFETFKNKYQFINEINDSIPYDDFLKGVNRKETKKQKVKKQRNKETVPSASQQAEDEKYPDCSSIQNKKKKKECKTLTAKINAYEGLIKNETGKGQKKLYKAITKKLVNVTGENKTKQHLHHLKERFEKIGPPQRTLKKK